MCRIGQVAVNNGFIGDVGVAVLITSSSRQRALDEKENFLCDDDSTVNLRDTFLY